MPFKDKEALKQYRETPARKAYQKVAAQEWYKKNRQRVILASEKARVKRRYSLTLGEYNKRKKETKRCSVCLRPFGNSVGTRPALDHNHVTGRLREFIHGTCNRAIGYLKEDPATLRRAADYLEKYQ